MVTELKYHLETLSEDKKFLQSQLIQAKQINKSMMFELDLYKQKHGVLEGYEDSVDYKALLASESLEKTETFVTSQ